MNMRCVLLRFSMDLHQLGPRNRNAHLTGGGVQGLSKRTTKIKKDGHYIIGQGNMYTLNDLINFRKFLKCIIWYFTDEKYIHSYSLSFKDIIFESKLKKYFLKFEDSKFFKSKFMNKNSNSWKYKIRKRIFSFSTLKKTIENNDFEVVKFYGGPFVYASKDKKSYMKNFFNNILMHLLNKNILPPLIKVADNCIFLSKPNY